MKISLNRILYLLIVGTVVAVAVAAVSLGSARARQDGEFIQVSVLAEKTANYGVDLNLPLMAPISMDLISSIIQDDADVPGGTTFNIDRPPSTDTDPPSSDPSPDDPDNPPGDDDDDDDGSGGSSGGDDDDDDGGGDDDEEDKAKDKDKDGNGHDNDNGNGHDGDHGNGHDDDDD